MDHAELWNRLKQVMDENAELKKQLG